MNVRKKVLIADDEEDLLRTLSNAAIRRKINSYEFVPVIDGHEVLDCIRKTNIDLIVFGHKHAQPGWNSCLP